jgi:hypothetical protein
MFDLLIKQDFLYRVVTLSLNNHFLVSSDGASSFLLSLDGASFFLFSSEGTYSSGGGLTLSLISWLFAIHSSWLISKT